MRLQAQVSSVCRDLPALSQSTPSLLLSPCHGHVYYAHQHSVLAGDSAMGSDRMLYIQVQSAPRSVSTPQVTQAAAAPPLEKPEGLQMTHAMPAPVLDRPEAAKTTQAAPAPPSKALKAAPERGAPKLLQPPQQAAQPVASLPARTSATADISVTSRGIQAALPPPEAPAAAALLPAPKQPLRKIAGRSDTQVTYVKHTRMVRRCMLLAMLHT